MFRDQANDTAEGNGSWNGVAGNSGGGWRDVDRKLRGIAKRRAALDAEEAALLREAERIEIWHELGYVSIEDYLERVLGYGPKAAQDRLRVARALADLPELAEALSCGELPFTALRELTRVAVPRTEGEWRKDAAGKTLRQIEEMVAGRKKGDRPTDPANPDLRLRTLRFEVTPATYALFLQAQKAVEEERNMRFNDDELLSAMCGAVLGGGSSETAPPSCARSQIAISTCPTCRQGFQNVAGKEFAISARALERAECDAQRVGSLDGEAPQRTKQDIPPRVRDFVWRRDHGKCCVPGCRSSRYLELHHIVFRSHGGDHSPSNILLACDAHHQAVHAGKLTITGKAPDELRFIWHTDDELRSDTRRQPVSRETPAAMVANETRDAVLANEAQAAVPADEAQTAVLPNEDPAAVPANETEVTVPEREGRSHMPANPTQPHVGPNVAPASRESTPPVVVRPSMDSPERSDELPRRSKFEVAVLRNDLKKTFVRMGLKPAEAAKLIDHAFKQLGPDAEDVALVREALNKYRTG